MRRRGPEITTGAITRGKMKPSKKPGEPVHLTLSVGELAAIDEQRGPLTRDEFITQAIERRMVREGAAVLAPYKEKTWLEAIKGRRPFLRLSFTMGESPHDQRVITPDVVNIGGQVGATQYDVKVDRLWADEHKAKAKKEALEALEAFAAQVRKAIENC